MYAVSKVKRKEAALSTCSCNSEQLVIASTARAPTISLSLFSSPPPFINLHLFLFFFDSTFLFFFVFSTAQARGTDCDWEAHQPFANSNVNYLLLRPLSSVINFFECTFLTWFPALVLFLFFRATITFFSLSLFSPSRFAGQHQRILDCIPLNSLNGIAVWDSIDLLVFYRF
ncbi:hypothetical protein F4810DRAFT_303063 [Camillea tinctor]|nr:hypothetical protein F4810DRAFT_303063 [Camillea tinctor]